MKSINLLILSKGTFQGSSICNAISAKKVFPSETRTVITERVERLGYAVQITIVPIYHGRTVVNIEQQLNEQTMVELKFNAVVIVLTLPFRATPENHHFLQTVRALAGTHTLATNTAILFTNVDIFRNDPQSFQEFIRKEASCNSNGTDTDTLANLIKDVHGLRDDNNACKWKGFHFSRCVAFDNDSKKVDDFDEQCMHLFSMAERMEKTDILSRIKFPSATKGLIVTLICLLVVLGLLAGATYFWTDSKTAAKLPVLDDKTCPQQVNCNCKDDSQTTTKLLTEIKDRDKTIEKLRNKLKRCQLKRREIHKKDRKYFYHLKYLRRTIEEKDQLLKQCTEGYSGLFSYFPKWFQ